jgi:hypothetical protein
MSVFVRTTEFFGPYGLETTRLSRAPCTFFLMRGLNYTREDRERAEELRIEWIDSTGGFVCAGSPIGSESYMKGETMKIVTKTAPGSRTPSKFS